MKSKIKLTIILFFIYIYNRVFQIDFNISKKVGFKKVVFYTTKANILPKGKWSFSTLIQLILFLSKFFIVAKKNYLSIKLKIGLSGLSKS